MQNQQGPEREGYALSDLVRWGPILAGFFAAMGFQALSHSLALGFGITTVAGAGAAVWAVITFIIATYIGGWIAARSLAVGGRLPALLNAVVVWGLISVFTVLLLSLATLTLSTAAAWGAFIALVLGLVTAVVGGLVGMHPESEFISR